MGMENLSELRDPRRQYRSYSDEMTQCIRAMNNANLAVYPVDARGLLTDRSLGSENRTTIDVNVQRSPPGVKEQQTMLELADRTGGRAYYNTNDLAKAIRESVSDAKLTYTIGYYPKEDKFDGKFHSIRIKVNRPGVALGYRNGYFDMPKPAQTEAARKRELRDSAFSPLDATEIGLVVELREVDPAKPSSIDMLVHIDTRAVTFDRQDGRRNSKLDILFVQKDPQGQQYNGRDDTLDFKLSEPNYQRIVRDGLAYRQKVERAAKATELRVIVRDAVSGSVGSVTVPLSQIMKR